MVFKALGRFGSFLKLYKYIQIETFISAITSHEKQRAKNSNSSQEVKLQVKFPAKRNTLKLQTPIIRHSTAIMPMVIHKQAIEKITASKTRKQQEAPRDFVYTPSCTCHLHVFWIFKKVLNCFSSSTFTFTITNNFCYLNDPKCRLNIFKISTQSVTRAV